MNKYYVHSNDNGKITSDIEYRYIYTHSDKLTSIRYNSALDQIGKRVYTLQENGWELDSIIGKANAKYIIGQNIKVLSWKMDTAKLQIEIHNPDYDDSYIIYQNQYNIKDTSIDNQSRSILSSYEIHRSCDRSLDTVFVTKTYQGNLGLVGIEKNTPMALSSYSN